MNDESLVGQLLADRYSLTRLIGRGGMASVYEASDAKLQRPVAIKVFSVATAGSDSRRESEVRLLARMNHPNLVTLHDAHLASSGSDAPSYLVMELVEGPDLGARMAEGPLGLEEAAGYLLDLAEALVAIHDAGVVHRDLKPGNILLAPTGLGSPAYRAKIGDFGIAHLVGAEPLTTIGTVIGTAAYLSPEQATGGDAMPVSDVYSLGLVIIESLTGQRAFPGTMAESIGARLARDPTIPADLPEAWRGLLGAMTAREPRDRPVAATVASAARELPTDPRSLAFPAATQQMLPPTKVLPSAAPTIPYLVRADETSKVRSGILTTPTRGALAAIVSLVVAVIVVAAVAVGTLSNSPDTVTSPSKTSTPATPRAKTSSTPVSASTSPAPVATPVPLVTAPQPVGPGNGKGSGNGKGHGNGNGNGNGNGKGHE